MVEGSLGDSYAVVWDNNHALWFDAVGGGYLPRYGAKRRLVKLEGVFQVLGPDGEMWEFPDFE